MFGSMIGFDLFYLLIVNGMAEFWEDAVLSSKEITRQFIHIGTFRDVKNRVQNLTINRQ